MVEDRGSVLRSDVIALAVERRWVVDGEEDLQEVLGRDYGPGDRDLESFRMVRGARADLFIRWVLHVPARVTDDDLLDTAQLLEDWLVAPEATAAEGRDLMPLTGTHIPASRAPRLPMDKALTESSFAVDFL